MSSIIVYYNKIILDFIIIVVYNLIKEKNMAMEDLSSNMRRYMKVQGLTSKKLAEECGIGQVAMSHILNGKSEPRSSTFIKICRTLKQSPDILLAESREIKAIHFRKQKSMSAKEKAARDILISEVDRWLKDYQEIEEYLNENISTKLPSFPSLPPKEVAQKIREELGIAPLSPINSVLPLIENMGIKIKLIPFGIKKVFGFSIDKAQEGPAIIINTDGKIPIERQIFTSVHELGHLLMHSFVEDISEGKSKRQEKGADKFAAEFLMPNEAFIEEWKRLEGFDWRERVLEIKKIFKVSYRTVLKRIDDLQVPGSSINIYMEFSKWYKKVYNHDLKDHYEPDALCAEDEPNGFGKVISRTEYGRFQKLVKNALEAGFISTTRAAGMLGISLMNMDELITSWDLPLEQS